MEGQNFCETVDVSRTLIYRILTEKPFKLTDGEHVQLGDDGEGVALAHQQAVQES